VFRLLYATLAVSLLGSSAAFGRELSHPGPPSPVIPKLAGLAGKSLSAIDGSTLALAPIQGGLAREITVPDGRRKKSFFVLLNDRLGTVSEGRDGGGRTVAGVFRVTGTGIAAEYADGRSEMLALNGAGGVSMVMHAPTGDVNCMAWYPAGHRFTVADRKAALADYARRLGIDTPRRSGVKQGCPAEKMDDPQSSPAVYNPPSDTPAKSSNILDGIMARALTFYTRKQAVNLPPSDLVTRLNPANSSEDGFENFYTNFLSAREGGYTSNDGNGSPANFGINQGANPDIDVSNLTRTDAKQILHDRYWLASGADRLPAALAAVHGDTAINMGVGAANDLLAQSDGDPQKYLDLRDARYRAIGAPDFDKAKYLPLWLGRNEDLRNFTGDSGLADQSSAAQFTSADRAQERYCDAPNDNYAAVPSCTNNRQALPPQWFR
jgi:hypothetical protein